jgi:hypothetical protein
MKILKSFAFILQVIVLFIGLAPGGSYAKTQYLFCQEGMAFSVFKQLKTVVVDGKFIDIPMPSEKKRNPLKSYSVFIDLDTGSGGYNGPKELSVRSGEIVLSSDITDGFEVMTINRKTLTFTIFKQRSVTSDMVGGIMMGYVNKDVSVGDCVKVKTDVLNKI